MPKAKGKGVKRPNNDPSTAAAAKRQALEKKEKAHRKLKCEGVAAVILWAEFLPPTVREMLATALPWCFPEGLESKPFPQQQRVITMVRQVLSRLALELEQQVASAAKAADEAKEQLRVDEEAKSAAEAALAKVTQEEETQKSSMARSGTSLSDAQAAHNSMLTALRSCDEEIGETAMERAVLAQKLEDDSLAADPDMTSRLEALNELLTRRALARVPKAEEVSAARTRVADVEAHRQSCKEALAAARSALHKCKTELETAVETVQKSTKAKNKAAGQVVIAQRRVDDFKSGGAAAFGELTSEDIKALPGDEELAAGTELVESSASQQQQASTDQAGALVESCQIEPEQTEVEAALKGAQKEAAAADFEEAKDADNDAEVTEMEAEEEKDDEEVEDAAADEEGKDDEDNEEEKDEGDEEEEADQEPEAADSAEVAVVEETQQDLELSEQPDAEAEVPILDAANKEPEISSDGAEIVIDAPCNLKIEGDGEKVVASSEWSSQRLLGGM